MLRHVWKLTLDDTDHQVAFLIVKCAAKRKIELKDSHKYLIDQVELWIDSKGKLWLISTTQTEFWRAKKEKVTEAIDP